MAVAADLIPFGVLAELGDGEIAAAAPKPAAAAAVGGVEGGDEGGGLPGPLPGIEVGFVRLGRLSFGVGVGGEHSLGDEVDARAVAGDRGDAVIEVGFLADFVFAGDFFSGGDLDQAFAFGQGRVIEVEIATRDGFGAAAARG